MTTPLSSKNKFENNSDVGLISKAIEVGLIS